jgi:hypothetical protein
MTHDSPPAPLRARASLPNAPRAARLTRNALLVWIAARFGLVIVAGSMGQGPALNAGGALAMVVVTAAGVALSERRQRGSLFYANLGVSHVWAGIIGVAVGVVMETAARLGLGSGG